ncbi:peroxisomal membrane protein PEX14-like [Artemia franciscana]
MEPEIREDLVSTAVRFLQDPRVAGRSNSDKQSFFKRKGLTEAEISAAFHKAGVPDTQILEVPPVYTNIPILKRHRSQWTIIRDISSGIIVLVSASYGFKYLYKKYIAPFLYGNNARKSLEESLVESNQAVLRTLTEMTTALQSMQETVKVLLERPSTSATATSAEIREIKAELVSLKGLLLSRKQFPTPPAINSASLPAWQLPKTPEIQPAKSKRDLEVKSVSPVPSSPEIVNEEETKETKTEASETKSEGSSSEIMVISAAGSDEESTS